MFHVLLIIQVLLGLSVIALVLMQQGKGADMGAAFGSGASGTVFGARGGGSFFTRATGVLAAAFFFNSLLMSTPWVMDREKTTSSVTEQVAPAAEKPAASDEAPVVDLPPADLPDTPPADLSSGANNGQETPPGDLPE